MAPELDGASLGGREAQTDSWGVGARDISDHTAPGAPQASPGPWCAHWELPDSPQDQCVSLELWALASLLLFY